jgi:hypothetical protein
VVPIIQLAGDIRPDNARLLPIFFDPRFPKLDIPIMIIARNRAITPRSPLPLQHALMVPIAQSKRTQRPQHIRNDVEVVELAVDLRLSAQSY